MSVPSEPSLAIFRPRANQPVLAKPAKPVRHHRYFIAKICKPAKIKIGSLAVAVRSTNWITNGMPERFPKLKTIWIESGLAWISFLMQRLDNEFMMRTSNCTLLKRKPSEYMREMYYTSQPMEMVDNPEALELTFKMIKADTQLLYSSDYLHWDMDLPSAIYDLPFLSEEAKRNTLGSNAQQLFNFDAVFSPLKLARRASQEGGTEQQLAPAAVRF